MGARAAGNILRFPDPAARRGEIGLPETMFAANDGGPVRHRLPRELTTVFSVPLPELPAAASSRLVPHRPAGERGWKAMVAMSLALHVGLFGLFMLAPPGGEVLNEGGAASEAAMEGNATADQMAAGEVVEIEIMEIAMLRPDPPSPERAETVARPVERMAVSRAEPVAPARQVETLAPARPPERVTSSASPEAVPRADPPARMERIEPDILAAARTVTRNEADPVAPAERLAPAPETERLAPAAPADTAAATATARPERAVPLAPETTAATPVPEKAERTPVERMAPLLEEEMVELALPEAAPRPTPRAEPAPRVAEQAPPRREAARPAAGSGGRNQADARRGTAGGSASGTSASSAARGTATSQAGNAAISNYPGQVASRLRRALRYPAEARRQRLRGEVHVSFTVAGNGSVSAVSVARSSGSPVLDQAAVETVRRAAPFPAIPPEARRSNWPFTVPLAFRR